MNPKPSNEPDNDHLRLAAHWASTAITHAQTEMLSSIHHNTARTAAETARQAEILESLDRSYRTSTELHGQEMKELERGITASCTQLDQLNRLVDALDANIADLDAQMSKAEAAVGLSLTGRLEQLARFFGPSTGGVPYRRQWASKNKAVPRIVNVSEYLD
ncbi:hypothetical protein IW140_006546 [Coemansia sp. RSA 1813]|nr:hypothetical protein EV178_006167 [Coemansia sp. RSA 1646]KAJ1765344.1 hypothetical protein LPJ74_006387 [Coemansia sp. RSA 1843]KAJ2085742.1 hypothetical protein IW138_006137 [Coemansia sp. RSA 986]KAJ2210490.1 hypothetical protein EV179_006212 [Coemansia sp. RSA 487]KAJ2561652.1 hypothetical protein IW140_006546 [Coemansia sp. RSA 1813]